MKIHSRHLHAPLRGIFAPNSVSVAHYASFIGDKSPTKCDAQLSESIFQTRSSVAERLKWNQIAEKYPTQWVGLIDVEWEPDNDATIKTAIVKYTGKTKGALTRMQIETKGELIARYTSLNIAFYIDGEAYTVVCVGASENEAADTDLA